MSGDVKTQRRYDSSRRREQARRTRRAILDAARRHFLERGYAETTIAAVADDADVSVETVYKAFGNKPGLLKAVVDVAIVGDDEPVPMMERDLVARIRAEADPCRKIAMYGEHLASSAPRHVPIQLLARAAAASDPGAAEVWQEMCDERMIGMTYFARELKEGGHLRRGLSVDKARDILWTLQSPEVFDLLVLQCGWTARRYGSWVAQQLIAALVPSEPSRR